MYLPTAGILVMTAHAPDRDVQRNSRVRLWFGTGVRLLPLGGWLIGPTVNNVFHFIQLAVVSKGWLIQLNGRVYLGV